MSSNHTFEHHHIKLTAESSNSCKYFPSTHWKLLTKHSLLLTEASCKTYTSNYSKLLAKLSLYLLEASCKNLTFLLTPSFCKLSLLPTGSYLQIFHFYLLIAPCRIFPPTYWLLLTELPGVTPFLPFVALTCSTLAVSIA